eukprot:TRINITY_DN1481_c0_g1_i1.p2 TRINITY_DN1481_c0_g1~~TRINITY_DN1481_c0_g1_i1.p2  ORF type:complete len:141 (-),score=10.69 TRINITY_DN1481_c0_g1_i1:418-840(-)
MTRGPLRWSADPIAAQPVQRDCTCEADTARGASSTPAGHCSPHSLMQCALVDSARAPSAHALAFDDAHSSHAPATACARSALTAAPAHASAAAESPASHHPVCSLPPAQSGECPWSDCTCKADGGSCDCKSGCGCGSTKA